MLKRREVTFKETTIKETVIHSDISAEDLPDFSSDISKLFAEEMKGQPSEQADLQTQYSAYDRARKHIWPTLRKVVRVGIGFLIPYSVTRFLDLLIEMI